MALNLTTAQTYLENVHAEMNARAQGKATNYSIKDRSLSRMTTDELLRLASYWQRKVNELSTSGTKNRITYARFQ